MEGVTRGGSPLVTPLDNDDDDDFLHPIWLYLAFNKFSGGLYPERSRHLT